MAAITRDPGRKRLFHVEDSGELRRRISRELAQVTGIDVVGFSDRADDAIAQIRRMEPDLVVLDLQLAFGSGIEILRELSPSNERPTFIVLTNHADARIRELSLRAGARYFFDKSTQLEEFVAFLKRISG
jgi:two-component system, NarL family, response regulator DevR